MKTHPRHIPEGYTVTDYADAKTTIATKNDDQKGRFSAIGWCGKAGRSAFNYYFKTTESRDQYVTNFLNARREKITAQQAARTKRNAPHNVKVGDIFKSSWGYDQTNIDYYEITEVKGSFVIVREIAQTREENGFMQGDCSPLPGQYVGDPMRKRIQLTSWGEEQNAYFKIASYAHAYYEKPLTTLDGKSIYKTGHYTCYA